MGGKISSSIRSRVDARLRRIANFLLLNASFIENLGLLKGKMGIAIFFFHYARYTNDKVFEEYAGELVDEIYEEINTTTPIYFEDGLTGIGWGIEYLIYNGFVETESDDVLGELDNIIYKHRLNSPILIDNTSEFFGYGFYHVARLMNDKENSNELNSLLKTHHLIFLVEECERILINKRFLDFNIKPLKLSVLNSILWFLREIYKLKLMPKKVKILLKTFPEYLEFIPEKEIQIQDRLVFNFLSQDLADIVDEKDFEFLFSSALAKKNSDDLIADGNNTNIIDDQVSLACMNLIYKWPDPFFRNLSSSFTDTFGLIDDETKWNERIDHINKGNLGLNGFAGIGFYLLNNIYSDYRNKTNEKT